MHFLSFSSVERRLSIGRVSHALEATVRWATAPLIEHRACMFSVAYYVPGPYILLFLSLLRWLRV